MEEDYIVKKLQEAKENSKERNFAQTFDCIVNLKNLDLKKPEHKVDFGVTLENYVKGKPLRIAAVVDHSMGDSASKVFDRIIYKEELESYKGNTPEMRKVAKDIDKFVVQADLMTSFAQVFGKYLGPLGKMPNPRLGMVINPKTNLSELYDKLQKTVHVQLKKALVLQFPFGSENEDFKKLAASLKHVLDSLEQNLPMHKENIKDISVKLTMGKLVRL